MRCIGRDLTAFNWVYPTPPPILLAMIGQSGGHYGVIQEQAADSRRDGRHREAARRVQSDEALMAAYLDGDMSAFAELFRRYRPVLKRILWRSLRDEVPDFVQQTFLHVHRARRSFKLGSLFRPWLISIAFNLKRGHFRQLSRRRDVYLKGISLGASPPAGPDVSYEADQVWRAVGGLPGRERRVLELLCGSGLSAADVAAEMRMTTAGVKSMAHRARLRLRRQADDALSVGLEQDGAQGVE